MESVAEMELSTITLQESDERLIQLVESFPNLYDKNLTAFRDMGLRELTWSEIADALNTPVEECKTRWTRLRDRYTREKRTLPVHEDRNGSPSTAASQWSTFPRLHQHMSFLDVHIKPRKRFPNKVVRNRMIVSEKVKTSRHEVADDDENSVEYEEVFLMPIEEDADELLIECVKEYPFLFDKKHSAFKDNRMKEVAWAEIADGLKRTVEECQNRWIRLRERYAREMRTIELEGGKKTASSFPYLEQMAFVYDHIKRRRSMMVCSRLLRREANRTSMPDRKTYSPRTITSNTIKLEVSPASEHLLPTDSAAIMSIEPPPAVTIPTKANAASDMSILSADRAFGLFIGAELEKMSEPAKTRMKSKIMAVLWE